jgi:hypothetical protein
MADTKEKISGESQEQKKERREGQKDGGMKKRVEEKTILKETMIHAEFQCLVVVLEQEQRSQIEQRELIEGPRHHRQSQSARLVEDLVKSAGLDERAGVGGQTRVDGRFV